MMILKSLIANGTTVSSIFFENEQHGFRNGNNIKKALQEIKSGKKTTHWIWYIFPQSNSYGSTKVYVGLGTTPLYPKHLSKARTRVVFPAPISPISDIKIPAYCLGNALASKLPKSMVEFSSFNSRSKFIGLRILLSH